MLKIGDFSKMTRISIRMLRYYDEHDVLKPACIDEESGYRFYAKEQLTQAAQICFLRNAGFSTVVIKEMLASIHEAKEIQRYLHVRKQELCEEREQIEETIIRIQKAEQLLEKEDVFMQYEVNLKEIPSVKVVSKRGIIPTYEREDLLWKGLCNELQERNQLGLVRKDGVPRAYFYDEGFKEHEVDVEVCQEVAEFGEYSDHLQFKTMPAVQCATVTFEGSFDQISTVCLAIGIWIHEHGYEVDGVNFCLYHHGPGSASHPKDYVTEVCFPVRKIK